MKTRLIQKLEAIRANPGGREFILADARDADMAWGIPCPGMPWPAPAGGGTRYRSIPEFNEEIRAVVRQGVVDVMLASVSAMSVLAHRERLFDDSTVTPAIRANDTTDIWCQRGASYRQSPSRPFSSAFIEEAQYDSLTAALSGEPVVNLGLYSLTFNNNLSSDLESLGAFKTFRAEAQRRQFNYFLEVFAPNVDCGLPIEQVPQFVNDHVARTMAGIPLPGRPVFLKVPYFGPRAMEELASYDPSIVVGIMGGSTGTTFDSFKLLADAQKYGARAALFGRRIKDAEDPLMFITFLRRIVDGQIDPKEAVAAYHGELQKKKIPPRRSLADDLVTGSSEMNYGASS